MHEQQSLHGIGPEWLYENDCDNTVRYVLGIRGDKPLFCLGINPSTAMPNRLDNTLKSVARLAQKNGFDGWVMLNIYPQRATDPNNLHHELNKTIHEKNIATIDTLLKAHAKPHLWAAWGTLITKRPYLRQCLSDIIQIAQDHPCKWVTIGKEAADGHPHHPLYLRKDEPCREFHMPSYIEKLKRLTTKQTTEKENQDD